MTEPRRPPTLASISSKTSTLIRSLCGEDAFESEHDPRQLAAGGDLAQGLGELAGVGLGDEFDVIETAACGSDGCSAIARLAGLNATVNFAFSMPSSASCFSISGDSFSPRPAAWRSVPRPVVQLDRERGEFRWSERQVVGRAFQLRDLLADFFAIGEGGFDRVAVLVEDAVDRC